jgi:hypothetical protein
MRSSFAQIGFTACARLPRSGWAGRATLPGGVLLGVVLLAGCASLPAPTAELDAAQQAVARADGVDGDQYAHAELATAREALRRAQLALADGQDQDARLLAAAAAADADLATALSRAALAEAELSQRRTEAAELRQRLQPEPGR